nr:hypothetical protein BaRGS_016785 [Batillaria attramentaria]
MGLKKDFQREFTFTGYDIMEDNATREVTPADLDQHDRLKHDYMKTYVSSCKLMGVQPNIAENRIGTKGIRAIAELLTTNVTLRKLDVSGSNLFDHDAKYIAMILENNYKLRELRVRHNKFGELGGLYLGPAIGK